MTTPDPLLEMADRADKMAAAANEYARIPMAERHRAQHQKEAAILRAAAAVIEAANIHWDGHDRVVNTHCQLCLSLAAYEAACKEVK